MNAMPNQLNGYQRLIIPPNVHFERNVEMGKLEYFDDYKARKSMLNSRMESQRTIASKNMATNNIYDFNRISHINNEPVSKARQITPAYEVSQKQYVSSVDKNKRNSSARKIGTGYSSNATQSSTGYQRIMPKAKSDFYFETKYPSYTRNMAYASGGSFAYAGAGNNHSYGGEVIHPRKQHNVEEEAYREPKVKNKVKSKRSGFTSTICVVIFTFIVLSGLLTRYAQISNLSFNNAKTEANISAMEEELQRIQMDIALKDDLGNIQERAEHELGMAHPGDENTVYLKPNSESAYEGGSVYVTDTDTVTPVVQADQTTQNALGDQTTTPVADNNAVAQNTDAPAENAATTPPATGNNTTQDVIDFKALF